MSAKRQLENDVADGMLPSAKRHKLNHIVRDKPHEYAPGELEDIVYDSDDECFDNRKNWQLAEGETADNQDEDSRQLVSVATLLAAIAKALPGLSNSLIHIAADYLIVPDTLDDGSTEITNAQDRYPISTAQDIHPTRFSATSFVDGYHRWTMRVNGPVDDSMQLGQVLQFGIQHDRDPVAFPNLSIGAHSCIVPRNSVLGSRYLHPHTFKPGSIVQCDMDLDKRRVRWCIDDAWGPFLSLHRGWAYSFAIKWRIPTVTMQLLPDQCLHSII